MYWFMLKEEFKDVYEKAKIVFSSLQHQSGNIVSTADIIATVEKMANVDVKFCEYDFSEFKDSDGKTGAFKKCGAAMYVSPPNQSGYREARILLNSLENPKMQRFSLVHELGHLILEANKNANGYLFSTHIDMDLTSIPKSQYEKSNFLKKEQRANVFALLVLMPEESFECALKQNDSLDEIGKIFGVTKDAVISRLTLGIRQEA